MVEYDLMELLDVNWQNIVIMAVMVALAWWRLKVNQEKARGELEARQEKLQLDSQEFVQKIADQLLTKTMVLMEENAALRAENQAQKERLATVTRAQDSMRKEFAQLKMDTTEKQNADKSKIVHLEAELIENKGQLRQSKEDKAVMEKRVTQLEQRIAELEGQMKTVNELLIAEQEKRADAEALAGALQAKNDELTALLAEKDVKIEQLQAELAAKVNAEPMIPPVQ